jgi:small GTP-binding protein
VRRSVVWFAVRCCADRTHAVFDNFSVIEDLDDKRVNVILWDTAGQEDYLSVRRICYEQTQVYLLCFSLVHPNSFHNIKSKWLPELRQYAPNATLFLVGTKTDLLDDKPTLADLKALDETPITQKQALALQKEIGAHLYLTCSGKDVASVNKVFRDVLLFLLDRDKKQLEQQKKQWKKELKELKLIEKELAKLRLKEQQERAAKAAATGAAAPPPTPTPATALPVATAAAAAASAANNDDDSADSAGMKTARPKSKSPTDDSDDSVGDGGKNSSSASSNRTSSASSSSSSSRSDDSNDDKPRRKHRSAKKRDDVAGDAAAAADRPARSSGSKLAKPKK